MQVFPTVPSPTMTNFNGIDRWALILFAIDFKLDDLIVCRWNYKMNLFIGEIIAFSLSAHEWWHRPCVMNERKILDRTFRLEYFAADRHCNRYWHVNSLARNNSQSNRTFAEPNYGECTLNDSVIEWTETIKENPFECVDFESLILFWEPWIRKNMLEVDMYRDQRVKQKHG